MPSKTQNYQGAEFFPQLPNFSAELAGKVCQELATLPCSCSLAPPLTWVLLVCIADQINVGSINVQLFHTANIACSKKRTVIKRTSMYNKSCFVLLCIFVSKNKNKNSHKHLLLQNFGLQALIYSTLFFLGILHSSVSNKYFKSCAPESLSISN